MSNGQSIGVGGKGKLVVRCVCNNDAARAAAARV